MLAKLRAVERTFIDEARDALTALVVPHRELADRESDIPPEVLASAVTRQIMCACVPREYGGGWRSARSNGVVHALAERPLLRVLFAEEAGRADAPLVTALPGPGLAAPVVEALARGDQRGAFFRSFVDPVELVWGALGMSEPAVGSDMTAITTRARKVPGGYLLTGTKMFVGNGGRAKWLVIFATERPGTGRFGMRCFLMPVVDGANCVRRPLPSVGFRALRVTAIELNDFFVSDEQRLGLDRERDAFWAATCAFDYHRPLVAAMAGGLAGSILDFLKARCKADGATHGTARRWRQLRKAIAAREVRCRGVRLLARYCALLQERGLDAGRETSIAKLQAAAVAMDVSTFALKAIGVAEPVRLSHLEKCVRDAKAFDLLEGTGDIHRLIVARTITSHLKRTGSAIQWSDSV